MLSEQVMSALWTVCCKAEQTVHVLLLTPYLIHAYECTARRHVSNYAGCFPTAATLICFTPVQAWRGSHFNHQYTRRDLLNQQLQIWICMLTTFLLSRLFDRDVGAFEKLLNRIRQEGKSFFFFSFKGRLLLRIKLDSAGPQITHEEWKAWLSLMMTGVAL